MIYTSGQQTSSVKGIIGNILGSLGHMVSLATSQLSCFVTKAATDSMYTCVPLSLYLQNQAGFGLWDIVEPMLYTMSIILFIIQPNPSSKYRQWL